MSFVSSNCCPIFEVMKRASASGHDQPVTNWLIVSRRRLLPNAYRSFSRRIANRRILNGCLHQQRSFKLLKKTFCEGLDPARSSRSKSLQKPYLLQHLLPYETRTLGGVRGAPWAYSSRPSTRLCLVLLFQLNFSRFTFVF